VTVDVDFVPPRRPGAGQAVDEGVERSRDTGLGDGVVDQILVRGPELFGKRPGVGEFEEGGGQPRVPFGVERLLCQQAVRDEGGAVQLRGADPVALVVVGAALNRPCGYRSESSRWVRAAATRP
jgi:hypothetical protein